MSGFLRDRSCLLRAWARSLAAGTSRLEARGELLGAGLLELRGGGHGLDAHDATAPVLAVLLPLLGEVGAHGLADLVEGTGVGGLQVGDGEAAGRLHVDERTEAGLALDDAVWDAHLAAESGQPDDNLHGVDIVGDDDQLGLLLLDEPSDVVDAVAENGGALAVVSLGAAGVGLGSLGQALLLLRLGLRAVTLAQAEELGSYAWGGERWGELGIDYIELSEKWTVSIICIEEKNNPKRRSDQSQKKQGAYRCACRESW